MAKCITFLLTLILISCDGNVTKISNNSVLLKNPINTAQKDKSELLSIIQRGTKGEQVNKYCEKMDKKFIQYGWGKSSCLDYRWNWVRRSYWGNIIPWIVAGEPEVVEANTTIIFCGVHGDEITPVKFCYDIMKFLKNNTEKLHGHRVVVAPLVTPDSFLKKYPTRTNARGVDANRNFPTK